MFNKEVERLLKEILDELRKGRELSKKIVRENEMNATKMEAELKGLLTGALAIKDIKGVKDGK
jgi:phage gp29-like protein